jgi:DNA-binding SARP family transcriptional activator
MGQFAMPAKSLERGHETSSVPNPVRLHLIGQMRAWSNTNESLLPRGHKARALLAILALSEGNAVSRSRAAELLWSRRDKVEARASLRRELDKVLSALEPAKTDIVLVTRDSLGLIPGAVWTDVAAVASTTCIQPDVLSLLDRDLLECLDGIDPSFDIWLRDKRQALRRHARSVAEGLLRQQTEPDAVIAAAKRLLQVDRTHEGAWRRLMNAHAIKGERGMAIRANDQRRAVLARHVATVPSNETRQLPVSVRGSAKVPRWMQ